MPPPPVPEMEANCYYTGLPSRPRLVARTGNTLWALHTGPWTYAVPKELRPVGDHALADVWEDNLALKAFDLLDKMKFKWTSLDVVRIGDAEESSSTVTLWIGVVPGYLSSEQGFIVASECRKLLGEHNITDVEVEIRESVVTRSTGPKLLAPYSWLEPSVDVREPLATTLGLPICAQSTPWIEGNGGFFITEGRDDERLLLVTARHVLFPGTRQSQLFRWANDNQPRHYVTLFGDAAFRGYLESIQAKINSNNFTITHLERRIEAFEKKDFPGVERERDMTRAELGKARQAKELLSQLCAEVSTVWSDPDDRILGHVILSPPFGSGVGNGGYTEDWAVIEVDSSKIDKSNFTGNIIDLGTCISPGEFTRMIEPGFRYPPGPSFEYPMDNLLKLKGTISGKEMRHPTARDRNNDPSLMVIKRGNATGLTVGRANNVFSYVCHSYGDGKAQISKEWAILPRNSKSGMFSAKGDSGSVVVDGQGRIGGLLTSGAGDAGSLDISYVTPITFLLERMKEYGLRNPNLEPNLNA